MGRGSAPPMAGNGPAVRGSSVQGFPCRYYDWRVLDEHFERGFRQRVKQFTQRRKASQAERTGSKDAGRAVFGSHYYSTKTRFDDRPSSHNESNGQTPREGVARVGLFVLKQQSQAVIKAGIPILQAADNIPISASSEWVCLLQGTRHQHTVRCRLKGRSGKGDTI